MQLQNQINLSSKRVVSNLGHNLQCTTSTSVNPDNVYLGTAAGDFKKLYYNHARGGSRTAATSKMKR